VFTLFCAGFDIVAQAKGAEHDEIVTDSPDITESAVVVPIASLQTENGLTWTKDRHVTLLNMCQSLVRLGVRKGLELRLSLPSRLQNLSETGAQSGLSDVSFGFKLQLGPLRGFDVSLIAAASAAYRKYCPDQPPSGSISKDPVVPRHGAWLVH
jgi:hypothetical protein